MSSAETAVGRIRASVDALPDWFRQPWRVTGEVVRTPVPGSLPVAETDSDEVAALVALLASPDVAVALADLLDAIGRQREKGRQFGLDWTVVEAHDALEAAILRGAETRPEGVPLQGPGEPAGWEPEGWR
jgi:hypothetical protein